MVDFPWSLEWGLNPRPTHYECVALPLSYPGENTEITPLHSTTDPDGAPTLSRVSQPTGTLIYDGDCGFCVRAAMWLRRRWTSTDATMVAAQELTAADATDLGLEYDHLLDALWWSDDTGVQRGHHAVAKGLQQADGHFLRGTGKLLNARAFEALGRGTYAFVAARRHRLPGGTSSCAAENSPAGS